MSKGRSMSQPPKLEGNCLRIPLRGEVIMGPFASKTIIPPVRVSGNGIMGIVLMGQLKGVLHAVTLGVEGKIRI